VLEVRDHNTLIDPKHYYGVPEEGTGDGLPASLMLRPPFPLSRDERAICVHYAAGYGRGHVPADLGSACLELAAWNFARYRGKRVGMTGSVRRGTPDQRGNGEHLELSMPENVRLLLEPYRRVTI
jgi:hypothetical protein